MQSPSREEIRAEAEIMRPSIEKTAALRGWKLNENRDIADSVIEGLARNKIIHGKRYCPCRIVTPDPEKNKAYICPCVPSEEDVARDGHCHCYLFFK
ncbi:MAG TPA: ferredoxin:thioredoxin reductase [Methanocorpusculum sp.]|nr:ferredoxin:thioredoxin reductase [Methanocorpusculum sp.]